MVDGRVPEHMKLSDSRRRFYSQEHNLDTTSRKYIPSIQLGIAKRRLRDMMGREIGFLRTRGWYRRRLADENPLSGARMKQDNEQTCLQSSENYGVMVRKLS